jgi:glucose uptake protein GlcU
MDLNTSFELIFGVVATALAIIGLWLMVRHKRGESSRSSATTIHKTGCL